MGVGIEVGMQGTKIRCDGLMLRRMLYEHENWVRFPITARGMGQVGYVGSFVDLLNA